MLGSVLSACEHVGRWYTVHWGAFLLPVMSVRCPLCRPCQALWLASQVRVQRAEHLCAVSLSLGQPVAGRLHASDTLLLLRTSTLQLSEPQGLPASGGDESRVVEMHACHAGSRLSGRARGHSGSDRRRPEARAHALGAASLMLSLRQGNSGCPQNSRWPDDRTAQPAKARATWASASQCIGTGFLMSSAAVLDC